MTLTNLLKKSAHMLPLLLVVVVNANADSLTQLKPGCRDKDQISRELEADNQGTLVKFFIDDRERSGKESKWVEVFYTSDIKTGNGYRLERSGNDKMCVVATTTKTKLFNNSLLDKTALLNEQAISENRLQTRREKWDAKTREFGGRQLTHRQIDKIYDYYLKNEDHNKILEELKADGMTDTQALDTLDKMTQRASLWAEMKKLEVEEPGGINEKYLFNELILELSQSAKLNPMIRATEYDLNQKATYIKLLSGNPNTGKAVVIASTLDGEWIKDYRVNVPSTADAPHGAEYTKYSKSLLGIAEDTGTKVP